MGSGQREKKDGDGSDSVSLPGRRGEGAGKVERGHPVRREKVGGKEEGSRQQCTRVKGYGAGGRAK